MTLLYKCYSSAIVIALLFKSLQNARHFLIKRKWEATYAVLYTVTCLLSLTYAPDIKHVLKATGIQCLGFFLLGLFSGEVGVKTEVI